MTQEKGYRSILEKVLHDVKDRKEGVLYACVEIMAPENLNEIIEHFSINQSASFYDDLQVLNNVSSFQPILKRVDLMNIRNLSVVGLERKALDWNPGLSVGLIVVVALIVVSLYSFLGDEDVLGIKQARNQIGEWWHRNNIDNNQHTSSPREKCGADLWLVIPCKRIDSFLRKDLLDNNISYNKTVLIDESVCFLATETTKYDPRIPDNNDWRAFPEGGDLFVQLYIPDGGDLIGDDLKRSLSRRIADKETITIKKIALLNDFSGLQDFNRA